MAVSLKDCRIGVIVTDNPDRLGDRREVRIGHVIGIGLNAVGEAMPVVQWARRWRQSKHGEPNVTLHDNTGELVHCVNLDLFTDDHFYEPR